jgi:hypothetical protein
VLAAREAPRLARRAAGDLARAREAWQQALAILRHPDAGPVRARLTSRAVR